MQNPPNGSPPDRNSHRISPPTDTGPLRGDGRSALPSNGHGPGNGEEPRRLQTAGNISQHLLQERLAIHVQLQIMRHAATLDLAAFENAAYYDQLQQAQRESARRPVEMVSGVFGLGRSLVTFATMVALLIGLSPWVAAAALIAPIPAFISGSRYGWWGFQMMRRQSPVRRIMSYLTTPMTTDEYAK